MTVTEGTSFRMLMPSLTISVHLHTTYERVASDMELPLPRMRVRSHQTVSELVESLKQAS